MPKREATAAADSLPVRSRGPVKVKLTKTGLFEAIDHCGKAERYMVWDTEVAGHCLKDERPKEQRQGNPCL